MKFKAIVLIGLFIISVLELMAGCGNIGGGGGISGGTEYTLTITCDGSGRVEDESGYTIVTRKYSSGSVVNLVPVGENGYWAFKSWSGSNGTEVNNNQITMNGNKNITAVFSRLIHNVTIEVSGNGTVSQELVMGALSLPTYKGDKIRLNPFPDLGWYFDKWEGDLTSSELQPELIVDSDKTIKAVFKQAIAYTNFIEGAENETSLLMPQGTWGKTTTSTHSGSYSWTDTPNGDYSGTFDISLRSCAIDMNGSQHPYLAFWHRYNTSYASCSVEVSVDTGVTWDTVLTIFSGTKDWSRTVVFLEDYKTDIIIIRFRIKNDYSYNGSDGWYIDDICINDQTEIAYTSFNEGAESETDLVYPAGEWGKTIITCHNGSYSWTDSPGTNYKSNVDYSLTTCIIDMNGSQNPYLEFWHRYNIGYGVYCYIEISNDYGNTWNQAKVYYGSGNIDWQSCIIDLRAYKTDKIQIRFRMNTSSYSSSYDGWYIDDISVKEFTQVAYTSFNEGAESQPGLMYPAGEWGRTTESCHSGSYSWTDSPGANYRSGVDYSLTTCIIDMNGSQNPYLEFWHRFNIGSGANCYIDISKDYGITWNQAKVYYGSQNIIWQSCFIDLSAYKSDIIRIRFRITTSSYSSAYDGWYIDDLTIKEYPQVAYTSFKEGAESETNLVLSDGGWGKTNVIYHNGSNSWTDSPGGNYANNVNTSLTSASINLTGSTNPFLSFYHRYSLENYSDYCHVEISTNGGSTWTQLASYTGSISSWGFVTLNLNAYKTQTNIKVRFRLTSDSSITNDGWYIDDIEIVDM